MAANVIHDFPGMYDEDMNTEMYLPVKGEITQAKYNLIKTNLGVYGPGRQVLVEGSKYYLLSDEPTADAEARIAEELKELDVTYPTTSTASNSTPASNKGNE